MDIQIRLTAHCVVEVHPLYVFKKEKVLKGLMDFNIAFGISYLDGAYVSSTNNNYMKCAAQI
jgi:hypothetical protein